MACGPCQIQFGTQCVPCEPGYTMRECEGCFDDEEPMSMWEEHKGAIIGAILTTLAIGITTYGLRKVGEKTDIEALEQM